MTALSTTPQEQPDGHTKGLIERLEAAEVGSRELDWLIADLFAYPEPWPQSALWPPFAAGSRFDKSIPAYTTSLDAALSLAERVLPGQARAMGDMAFDPPGLPWATIWTTGGDPKFNAHAATPALALCIAILKAHEARTLGDRHDD